MNLGHSPRHDPPAAPRVPMMVPSEKAGSGEDPLSGEDAGSACASAPSAGEGTSIESAVSGGNRSLGAVDVARPDGAPAISVGLPAGRIPHYYTSKYAGLDGLPRDLGYGRDERLEAVRKYIGYVFEPPDGLGDPVENAEHLRAACARLLVGRGTENAALLMLDAFSALATEPTPPESEVEAAVSPSLQVAVRQYRKAYRRFTHAVPWDELHPVLALFSGAVVDVNAGLDALSRGLYQEGLLYRTLVVLRDVNRTLST